MGWTRNDVSELEIQLVASLHDVKDVLAGSSRAWVQWPTLRPGPRTRAVAAASHGTRGNRAAIDCDRHEGDSPGGLAGCVAAVSFTVEPLAQMGREAHLAVALRDGVRIVALGREDALHADTIKLAESG